MGLKFLNSAIFGFFGIGVTIACLKDFGMYPVDKDLLTISVNIGSAESRHFFSKNVGIGSNAHDLVGESMMIFLSSSVVTCGNASYLLVSERLGMVVRFETSWSVNCSFIFSSLVLKTEKTHLRV